MPWQERSCQSITLITIPAMPEPPSRLPARPVRSAPEQISSAVREWILDGTLSAGDRLPSEEQMATMFGVSRPTVREALRELRSAHLLSSSRGRRKWESKTICRKAEAGKHCRKR
jgi:DNA-binding transcriptional ArsR family regulator